MLLQLHPLEDVSSDNYMATQVDLSCYLVKGSEKTLKKKTLFSQVNEKKTFETLSGNGGETEEINQ